MEQELIKGRRKSSPKSSQAPYKDLKNLWSNSLQGGEDDEGLTQTKDEGTCLRRLSMFRKEVH